MTGKELVSAKQELDKFLLSIDCLDALNCGSDIPNVFDVLRISRNEIRHSNILAWLLDSSGNHGLEDSFIREFVKSIIKSNPQKEYPVHDWLLADYTKNRVIREWHHRRDEEKKKTDSLDILVLIKDDGLSKTHKGLLLAIENKIGANEGENQTKRYYEDLERSYPNFEKICLFLTPNGLSPIDNRWATLPYSEIKTLLEKLLKKKDISAKSKFIIEDYIEVIKRETMTDQDLVELCTKIYNENKVALDIIFSMKKDDSAILAECFKSVLKELNDDPNNRICYDPSDDSGVTYVRFGSIIIDDLLGESSTSNSWKTKKRYRFEINCRSFKEKDDCFIAFVLTINNLDTENANKNYQRIKGEYKDNSRDTNYWKSFGKKSLLKSIDSFSEEDIQGTVDNQGFRNALKKTLIEYVTSVEERVEKAIQ